MERSVCGDQDWCQSGRTSTTPRHHCSYFLLQLHHITSFNRYKISVETDGTTDYSIFFQLIVYSELLKNSGKKCNSQSLRDQDDVFKLLVQPILHNPKIFNYVTKKNNYLEPGKVWHFYLKNDDSVNYLNSCRFIFYRLTNEWIDYLFQLKCLTGHFCLWKVFYSKLNQNFRIHQLLPQHIHFFI